MQRSQADWLSSTGPKWIRRRIDGVTRVQRALASSTSNVSCERQRSPRARPHGLRAAVSGRSPYPPRDRQPKGWPKHRALRVRGETKQETLGRAAESGHSVAGDTATTHVDEGDIGSLSDWGSIPHGSSPERDGGRCCSAPKGLGKPGPLCFCARHARGAASGDWTRR